MSRQIAIVVWLFSCHLACAQEQLPAPQPLPVPIVTERVLVMPLAPLGSRDVWKNFAIDSSGRPRPRVVLAPYGSSYYYYNGSPYPYLPSHNLWVRPPGN